MRVGGVPLQSSAQVSEGHELVMVEVAASCQDRVVGGCAVAFGEEEHVSFSPLGLFRADIHVAEVENYQDVNC